MAERVLEEPERCYGFSDAFFLEVSSPGWAKGALVVVAAESGRSRSMVRLSPAGERALLDILLRRAGQHEAKEAIRQALKQLDAGVALNPDLFKQMGWLAAARRELRAELEG